MWFDQKSTIVSSTVRSEYIRRRIDQLPRSRLYSKARFVLSLSVAYRSAGVRRRSANQPSTSATFGDSGIDSGDSCWRSHASGVPAWRSCPSARWVNPVPKRFRYSRSREVAADEPFESGSGSGIRPGVGSVVVLAVQKDVAL